MTTLFHNIRKWAEQRELIGYSELWGDYQPDKATIAGQIKKLDEEVQELKDSLYNQDKLEFKDAIGDCVVVLTILAAMHQLDIEDCIDSAYKEISTRKGKMVDGIFVKDTK